jgi:hypothetical protein
MTDIMQAWKERRFIVAEDGLGFIDTIVVLTDIEYWTAHIDELIVWCSSTPGVRNEGMTVVITDPEALTLFLLRWS